MPTLENSKQRRLEGIDLARFFALVGMVIVNFDVVMVAHASLETSSTSIATLLQGRAASTFVVLAGLGLGLGAAQSKKGFSLATHFKRTAFLLVLGLLNMLIFPADIIHYYAFYFLFGIALLRAPLSILVGAIVFLTAGFLAMSMSLDYDKGWNWPAYEYTDFWTLSGFIRNLFFNGWHPVFPWLALLLFGIGLSRLQLGHSKTQWALLGIGTVVHGSTLLLANWLTQKTAPIDSEAAILFTTSPIPPMPLFVVAGTSIASAALGFCLLLETPLRSIKLLSFLTATGRQTLTLYIAHIILGMGTIEVLGLLENQSPQTALIASVSFCLLAIAYSNIWSRFFKRGPLESLMRLISR